MLLTDQNINNKSIMLSLIGAPNVGKSSLVNYLLGTNLSVVTHKPQTTRNKFHCVLTVDNTEIILVDTPGVHKSSQELNLRLNQQALEGTNGTDVNLMLIDIKKEIIPQFLNLKYIYGRELENIWVVFTKSDLVENSRELPLSMVIEKAKEIFPNISKHFLVSSQTGDEIHELVGEICDAAETGYHLYNGEISNKNERFFATEYIREQAFLLLQDELPYELAVTVEEFRDVFDTKDKRKRVDSHISASILVNRASQRAIVIGKQGSMIKNIGTNARKKIEIMTGARVHLNLHVKVAPRWFKNNFILEELGLPRAEKSHRVWRQR